MKQKHSSQKKSSRRIRRAAKTRYKIGELGAYRLFVFRSAKHIYAYVASADKNVLFSSSTLSKEFRKNESNITLNNMECAQWVGKDIAIKAINKGLKKMAFDRSGYKYHGRIKALATSAREAGLEF